MNRIFSLVLLMLMGSQYSQAQIVINEIMQSNIDCIMDDLNDFPDSWVELYNTTSETINLSGYSIGTSDKAKKAWALPSTVIPPKGYILVYCDKESTGMHTSFRLESGKDCTCYLFKDGTVIDQLPAEMKKQPAPNIAFGRKTDGGEEWGYQEVPTPKAPNCGKVLSNKKILGDPVFSIPGRVFTGSGTLTLELSLPEDAPKGTRIVYTKDFTEPTASSKEYSGPISISSTTIVRAKLVCDGYLSPRSVTQSYIKFPRQLTLPVISITTDDRYFYDSRLGIYSDKETTINGVKKKNYEFNWRRPINFEMFEEVSKASVLNQLGEARVTGGASRGSALKSLGIYANKRFGEKRLNYEFFPDQRPGITDFKSIMMRNAGNDFDYLYMRDAVIQRIMAENVDIDWQAWRPAIFYLNGKYMGMLNIRERSNEDNVYTNYEGLEDIDMIENWNELKEGTIDNWKAFQAFYEQHDHTYAEYDKLLDVQEFMNVMIMNLFFCNLDFPGNNIVFWRPQADGGRWRVIVKDTDFGLGLYGRPVNYNTLQWIYNPNHDRDNAWANQYEHTRLFRRLMEDETFKREFIDRCAIYMGDFMNFERTWEIWEPMYNLIKFEYPNHRNLFNPWWPNYTNELNSAKTWLKNRKDQFYTMVSGYYGCGTPVALSINTALPKSDLERISVSFNGVTLTRGTFSGRFFQGRKITLHGDNVSGWTVTDATGRRTEYDGSDLTLDMPSSPLQIAAKVSDQSGIESVEAPSTDDGLYYDLQGRRSTKGRGLMIHNGKIVNSL